MAELTCPACNGTLTPGTILCPNCGHFMIGDVPLPAIATPPAAASARAASDGHHQPEGGTGAGGVPCTTCGRQVNGTACDHCGTPVDDGAVLELPGGERLALAEGVEVILGRESREQAIAAALGSLDTVSRRHARVTLRGTEVEVADVESTNGTWLDGRRVGTHPVRRQLPVRIGLGQSVSVEIRGTR